MNAVRGAISRRDTSEVTSPSQYFVASASSPPPPRFFSPPPSSGFGLASATGSGPGSGRGSQGGFTGSFSPFGTSTPPEPVKEIAARLAWLGETPLRPRSRVLLKHGTATVKAMLGEIVGALDLETMQLRQTQSLELNDIGSVVLRTPSALPLDDYAQLRRTGAFLLIDEQSGNTLAAGLVGEG